jgi:site-specific DNA-methyltransferase (adenine-specific)
MRGMADGSVDSIVTDPPYELGFMGKSWDSTGIAYSVEMWTEALRVLKPGGHLLAFSGSRTYHRMAVAIEDAGFQIRDQIMWLYGSGFPKSHNVSKGIDKAAGAEREMRVNERWADKYPNGPGGNLSGDGRSEHYGQAKRITDGPLLTSDPVTPAAQQWEGWGTALKPAHEPIVLARKPFAGTVAKNVLQHGTGALNIDGSRVVSDDGFEKAWDNPVTTNISAKGGTYISQGNNHTIDLSANKPIGGRWPANVIHDGSDEVVDGFPDNGSAARFFYCAKANKRDRNEGLDDFEARFAPTMNDGIGGKEHNPETASKKLNHHPTVKPVDLMRYLVKLVTPPKGVVLDPFMGSGSTGKGAVIEGFNFVGIEQDADYLDIARARIQWAGEQEVQLGIDD